MPSCPPPLFGAGTKICIRATVTHADSCPSHSPHLQPLVASSWSHRSLQPYSRSQLFCIILAGVCLAGSQVDGYTSAASRPGAAPSHRGAFLQILIFQLQAQTDLRDCCRQSKGQAPFGTFSLGRSLNARFCVAGICALKYLLQAWTWRWRQA